MSTGNKTYLGDSVYAQVDPCGDIVLTTENGEEPSNRIVMEWGVFCELLEWVKSWNPEGMVMK